MRRMLGWLGRGCVAAGVILITADLAMRFMGLSPSYNLGDPSKFEFILISFWQIGAILIVIGGVIVVVARGV